jgi:REP element-mobilizing transposase RayT
MILNDFGQIARDEWIKSSSIRVEIELDEFVVMPNHFHALVEPAQGITLGDIVKKWKGGSAREINLACGRSGTVWQAEPFDHIVRSTAQMNHFRRYVAENPGKAKLRRGFVPGIGADAGLTADAMLEHFGLERREEQ